MMLTAVLSHIVFLCSKTGKPTSLVYHTAKKNKKINIKTISSFVLTHSCWFPAPFVRIFLATY